METANDMRMKIVGKAGTDEAFRSRLLTDPKGAIGEELGIALPVSMAVKVHEEDATTLHLVLPPASRLSEGDLQVVAGSAPGDRLGGGEAYHGVPPPRGY